MTTHADATHSTANSGTEGSEQPTHSPGTGWSSAESSFPAPPTALADLMSGEFVPQRKFKVPAATWLRSLETIPEAEAAITGLPSWINRNDAVDAVREYWHASVTCAFVAVMVWAYGEKAGYAPYRVLRVLTACKRPDGEGINPRVVAALQRSIEIALADGAVEGFSYLNDCTHKVRSHQRDDADMLVGVDCGRIYGLGPSFFTKWLQVGTLAFHPDARALPKQNARASRLALPDHPPAPMWDSQVIRWLEEVARSIDQEIFDREYSGSVDSLHEQWHTDTGVEQCDDACAFALSAGDDGQRTQRVVLDGAGWSPTTPEGDLLRLRLPRTDHYERYVLLLEHWGEPHGLTAAQVADRIYRLIRQDGEARKR